MLNSRVAALGLSLLMVGAMAGSAFAGTFGKNVNYREARQSNRIQHGVQDGQLTRNEARNLRQGQRRVDRFERVARSDGHISSKEFQKLERMQNRQSNNIYKQAHDRQNRF